MNRLFGLTTCLLGCSFLAFAGDPLQFQGIGMQTDLLSLASRFPGSNHSVCCVQGFEVFFKDQPDVYREMITHETGRYILRVAGIESIAHLYYFDGTFQNGVWNKLLLSFERPYGEGATSPRKYPEHPQSRCPPCAPILADLSRAYGKPHGPTFSSEEALEQHIYSWTRLEGSMELVCGNYQLERSVFALEILLRPSR
jgi:hypothetical protein